MDFDFTSVPIRKPPKRGVTLLGPGKPSVMNACLHFSHDMTTGYVEGYRKAAERLIERVEQTHEEQDYLVYPILFLYRHHIELRLKQLLELLHRLGIRTRPARAVHDLWHLWSECQPDLESLTGKEEDEWFTSVGHCIKQLADIDPMSDAFRYPKRRDGSKSVASLTHINLATLRETMDSILDWLDGAACILSDYRSDLG
jgi:hypothetical protein